MFDLVIRGGNVVTPQGVITCDVGIAGETIAALGTLPVEPSSTRVIDATAHIVMPVPVPDIARATYGEK